MGLIEFKESLKVRIWEWIPVLGTLAFVMRIEFQRAKIENRKMRSGVGHYRSLYNLVVFLIALPFLILFIIWKVNGNAGVPWYFWIGLGIALSSNLTVFIPLVLYKISIKRFIKKAKQNIEEDLVFEVSVDTKTIDKQVEKDKAKPKNKKL